MTDDSQERDDERSSVDSARRRLLRIGVYAAPAVLGTMVTRNASAQSSCTPQSCVPGETPCSPLSG